MIWECTHLFHWAQVENLRSNNSFHSGSWSRTDFHLLTIIWSFHGPTADQKLDTAVDADLNTINIDQLSALVPRLHFKWDGPYPKIEKLIHRSTIPPSNDPLINLPVKSWGSNGLVARKLTDHGSLVLRHQWHRTHPHQSSIIYVVTSRQWKGRRNDEENQSWPGRYFY